MTATEKIYEVIKRDNLKQSSVAVAAGYTPKQFNDLLKGRKRFTASDVAPICRALKITPNELFGFDDHGAPTTPTPAA